MYHEFRVPPSTAHSNVWSAPIWSDWKEYATRHFQTSLFDASWQVQSAATPSGSVLPFGLTNVVIQTAWYLSPSLAMTARPPSADVNSHAPVEVAQLPSRASPAWRPSAGAKSTATTTPTVLRIVTSLGCLLPDPLAAS
jgi:hypothetical protein